MNDSRLTRMIAVMLATKQYAGTAYEDEDVWQEDLSDDERDDHMLTAREILAALDQEGTMMTADSFGGHAAISLGIEDGLREAGGELHGCTPSMLVLPVQRRIAAERSLAARGAKQALK